MNHQFSVPIAPATAVYQAPAIESVVTFESLQREVFYAGGGGGGGSFVPVL